MKRQIMTMLLALLMCVNVLGVSTEVHAGNNGRGEATTWIDQELSKEGYWKIFMEEISMRYKIPSWVRRSVFEALWSAGQIGVDLAQDENVRRIIRDSLGSFKSPSLPIFERWKPPFPFTEGCIVDVDVIDAETEEKISDAKVEVSVTVGPMKRKLGAVTENTWYLSKGYRYSLCVSADGYNDQQISIKVDGALHQTVRLIRLPKTGPSTEPTVVPSTEPTVTPSIKPAIPVKDTNPKDKPATKPTPATTAEPTAVPTTVPTSVPTTVPTSVPTAVPTSAPTSVPPQAPTGAPSQAPTTEPTGVPSQTPTGVPVVD